LANKSNRSAKAAVHSLTREGREGARESVANTKLPDNQELEAMAQHEKKSRECRRLANKSNRSARARVNSSTGEGSKQERVWQTW